MISKKSTKVFTSSTLTANLVEISQSYDRLAELQESQIRWFYKDANDKQWTAFLGYDSRRLEDAWRRLCRTNSLSNLNISFSSELDEPPEVDVFFSDETNDVPSADEIPKTVSVLGGLFDANIKTRSCQPVYWSNEKRSMSVLRGSWFRDGGSTGLQPLDDETMADQLEIEYIRCYSESQLSNSGSLDVQPQCIDSVDECPRILPGNKPLLHNVASSPVLFNGGAQITETSALLNGQHEDIPLSTTLRTSVANKRKLPIHTVRFMDCHVDLYGLDEAYLYHDTATLYIRQKLGMQKVGTRLHRGYNQSADLCDKLPDVTHLCFVIHGIGQKMGTNLFLKGVTDLRETCSRLKEKYFNSNDAANERVEFLPVEWRSSLQLDGDTVDSITPVSVRYLRTTLNSSAMDIMYYTSPLYRSEISSSLSSELNRLYATFCSRNPQFEARGGQVSVIAHSLGCVLFYDLITGWSQPTNSPQDAEESMELAQNGVSVGEATYDGFEHRDVVIDDQTPNSSEILSTPMGFLSPSNSVVLNSSAFAGTSNDTRSLSTLKLQRMARVRLQLEAARTEVNRLEQELAHLSIPPTIGTLPNSNTNGPPSPSTPSIVSSPSSPSMSYFSTNPLHFKDNAYRLEPLVLRHYSSIRPTIIHRVDATDRPDYDSMPLTREDGKELPRIPLPEELRSSAQTVSTRASNAQADKPDGGGCDVSGNQSQRSASPENTRSSLTSLVFGFFSRSTTEAAIVPAVGATEVTHSLSATEVAGGEGPDSPIDPTQSTLDNNDAAAAASPRTAEQSRNPNPVEVVNGPSVPVSTSDSARQTDALDETQLRLEHRMDYQLQAARYENLYISILTSHTSYWCNADVSMFILSQVFGNSTDQQASS